MGKTTIYIYIYIYITCPVPMSLELFKMRPYDEIHINIQESFMNDSL